MPKTHLAKAVFDSCHITGKFLLRSGVISHEYFDKYLFEGNPTLLKSIAEAMLPLIPDDVEALAALEMGGIPVATLLSQLSGLPTLFVRKEAKAYGTCKLAEGGDCSERKLLIVEDVVTSGGQILSSVASLRQLGARIDTVVCVIDREAGGTVNLAEAGLVLRSLLTMTEIKKAAGV